MVTSCWENTDSPNESASATVISLRGTERTPSFRGLVAVAQNPALSGDPSVFCVGFGRFMSRVLDQ